jgi:3'-5' exoribonuclease Rv2179c-like domain
MEIFYDCEFVERGRDVPMQLVSIGMASSLGAELYAINEESLSNVMRHPFTGLNVVPHLPIRSDDPYIFEWDKDHIEYRHVWALDRIIEEVRRFITDRGEDVQLWAYYGAYDHVILAQLFGSMGELPAGVPMYTHDLQQLHEEHPEVALPPEPARPHHAMEDARWVQEAYNRIRRPDWSGDSASLIISSETILMDDTL